MLLFLGWEYNILKIINDIYMYVNLLLGICYSKFK